MQSEAQVKEAPVAVIAGVGEGVGLALAHRCAAEGMTTIMVARNQERLLRHADAISDKGGRAIALSADVRDEESVRSLFERITTEYGVPELVVYNAGAQHRDSILNVKASLFEKVWRLTCFGGFLVSREAARHMVNVEKGTIIFTGATASLRGGSEFGAFASAKFGLRALAQSMARELGPKGLHIAHVIIDGAVDMPRIHELFPGIADRVGPDGLLDPMDVADAYLALHHQKRSAWSFEIDVRPWVENF